jgi:hypothetical protein
MRNLRFFRILRHNSYNNPEGYNKSDNKG